TLGRARCRFPGRNSVHGRRIPVRPQPLVPAQLPPPPSSRRGLTPELGPPGGACLACAGGVAAPFMGAFSVVATPSYRPSSPTRPVRGFGSRRHGEPRGSRCADDDIIRGRRHPRTDSFTALARRG